MKIYHFHLGVEEIASKWISKSIIEAQITMYPCEDCRDIFTRKDSLLVHRLPAHSCDISDENKIVEFKFESNVSEYWYYRHLWIPKIGEQLICARVNDKYAVFKDCTAVGYIPHHLSEDLFQIMQSGGSVKVEITANPVYTMTLGLIIPCIYILSGKEALVKGFRDNVSKM